MTRSQPTTEHRWPDPDIGPWLIRVTWDDVDGRPEPVAIHITGATEQPVALTASVLRALPFAELTANDRADVQAPHPGTPPMRKSTEEKLREVARIYAAAAKKPTTAVAQHLGISQGGASNWVARARQAGFLPPTSAGVATRAKRAE